MDRTICANESSRGRGFSASRRLTVFGSVGRRGEGAESGLRGSRPGGVGFCGLRRSQMLFCFTKLWSGDAPEPPNDRRAPYPWARSAGTGSTDGARGPRGHRQPFTRRERASTPFPWLDHPPRGCRVPRPEARSRGTPTPPRVEFVRYRRSCGHGFRQTALKTPRMAVRAAFRAQQGWGEHDLDGCHAVGQGAAHGRTLKPATGHGQATGWQGPTRITSAGSPATTGLRSAVAPATVLGGSRTSPPAAPVAGRKRRVRGGAAPRQPRSGTRGVWPQRVCWLVSHNHA